ncbi:hypothetical protein [Pseudooceanicola sp. C21-150M6]|uniref:hypothetical protein n=1 Tax=Pseudooceanicola sp. C21-150M6 TaxID=3434355 RepID=UPI003D7FB507
MVALLSGCAGSTNPFIENDPDAEDTVRDDLPPGTENPSARSVITRSEAETESGGGTALGYEYRGDTDEFYVDNLPFDADNVYARGTSISSIGPTSAFQVYESDSGTIDPVTTTPVSTFSYRAIYGQSRSGQVQFAIVRSGNYVDYGFGGYVYQRNGETTDGTATPFVLPDCSGACQADYRGDYAGIRVFEGSGGLEYTQGEAQLKVDFEDFNEQRTGAVLFVRDRRLFDVNGNDITASYLAALEDLDPSTRIINDEVEDGYMPTIVSVVDPTNVDTNGEIAGEISSYVGDSGGTVTELDSGNYYAILSGEGAESEVVGIVVVESSDPRFGGAVSVQETGGFILYRQ